ncbi:YTH domain containing protein [Pleurotus pulmonarius]
MLYKGHQDQAPLNSTGHPPTSHFNNMVEPAPPVSSIRGTEATTPTPRNQSNLIIADEIDLSSCGPTEHSTVVYVPGLVYDCSPGSADTQSVTRSPRSSDGSGDMSDSHPLPDRGRRAHSRGRVSARNSQTVRRPPHVLAAQSSAYDASVQTPQNIQDTLHTALPSPPALYPQSPPYQTPYGHPPPFVNGYTLPPHTTMNMGPSFTYRFPHADNMPTQQIHSSHLSFPIPGPSQMYQHPATLSKPPSHTSSSPQASNSHSFSGNRQFPQYHHHSAPYTYLSHSFPPTPTHFQPPYPPTYPQHFPSPSPPDHEHGAWYYVPSHPQSPQYEGHPQYVGHYPISYPSHHHEVDPRYGSLSASASTSSTPFQSSPVPPGDDVRPLFSTPPRSPASIPDPPLRSSPDSPHSPVGPALNPPPERHVLRRPYHPNPPAHRSEWVMWVGNVPSDATHDEAWKFFATPPSSKGLDHPNNNGVLSIFLISRSCCVFVNFDNAEHLRDSIERFHGVPLRPNDPRCPKLVCRVRRTEDDLRAGVGGQRGNGMHMRWIKEQKRKCVEHQPAETSSSEEPSTSPSSVSERYGRASMSSDDDGSISQMPKTQSSSSGSFASTNSSILAKYFPQRFFILKSLTQYDLDLSVETGLWATQKHNESILDQAFRTSKDVFLIFGVNKSGEFYGYARMAGPLHRGERQISWASRTDSSTSSRSPCSASGLQRETIAEESMAAPQAAGCRVLSPTEGNQVDNSPSAMSPEGHPPPQPKPKPKANSAPSTYGRHQQFSSSTLSTNLSLDPGIRSNLERTKTTQLSRDFELDPEAPQRAIQDKRSTQGSADSMLDAVPEVEEREGEVDGHTGDPHANGDVAWGDSFKVEWICTERLPFQRTRLLRNPWNRDKEIKVSRDGTELEPTIGLQLLAEWKKYTQEVAAGGLKNRVASNRPAPPSQAALPPVR